MFRLRWQQDQYFATSTTPVEVVGDCRWPSLCQFWTYQQCMAAASGTTSYCQINPRVAFAGPSARILARVLMRQLKLRVSRRGAARLVEIGLKAKAE